MSTVTRSFNDYAADAHDHLGRIQRAIRGLEDVYDLHDNPTSYHDPGVNWSTEDPQLAEALAQLRRDALRIVRDVERMTKAAGLSRFQVDQAARRLDR